MPPQRVACDVGIHERVTHAGDVLVRLMALAGDQHHVVRARLRDGLADRGIAITLHGDAGEDHLDGGAGKVINGFSGYGASLYVPEAQLEEAKDLLASRPVEDEETEEHA